MKVGMISLGCPKNRVASEQMLKKLADAGYELKMCIRDRFRGL